MISGSMPYTLLLALLAADQGADLSAAKPWYAIGWSGWVGVVSAVLTVPGLYLAWAQSRAAKRSADRARTAAVAAFEAVRDTENSLRAKQLAFLIPQLQAVAGELDAAARRGDRDLTLRALDEWRFRASHVKGLFRGVEEADQGLVEELQSSTALASTAVGVIEKDTKPVLDASKRARESIHMTMIGLVAWMGTNVTRVDGRQTID